MRLFLLFLLAAASAAQVCSAAFQFKADIVGTPAEHQVQWTSRPCYNYTVECSLNVQTGPWTQVGDMRGGTGDWMWYDYSITGARMYYRVREHDLGYWFRPCPSEKCYKEGGVIFGFDLSRASSATVTKLCISKRLTGTSTWYPIGTLTDILPIGGVKTVRGPSIWIPNETGTFEVKVVAKNSSGATVSTDTRQIIIAANTPPTNVAVTGYSSTTPPIYNEARMAFQTTAND